MAEPTQAIKPTPKMVPEGTLVMKMKEAKEREKALKDEMAELKQALADTKSELQIKSTNVEDDEDVARVRALLLEEDKKINAKIAKHEKDLASFNERKKESDVQSLAAKYQLEIDDIKDAEDPEKEALRLTNERLAREKEEPKKETPESVLETGSPALKKVAIKDLSPADFDKKWAEANKTAVLSR